MVERFTIGRDNIFSIRDETVVMQLKQISLYSNELKRRDIEFNLSKLNIITGASKKGKTSILEIVEYCLGSSDCGVAAGHIRETVGWYSVLLQFDDMQIFIARKSPLLGMKANGDVCFLVGSTVIVPEPKDLKRNSNIDSAIQYLSKKIGIPEQVTEVADQHTRNSIKLAFKHSRYLIFQSQDEIANKRILFHRQAEPFIPQMIKDTLPYFIGATDDNRLGEMELLRTLKRQKAKMSKQLREIEALKGDGLIKGGSLLAEAAKVGLYSENIFVMDDKTLTETLLKLTDWKVNDSKPLDSEGKLYKVESDYKEYRNEKRLINIKLQEAKKYESALLGFDGENTEQKLRLQSLGIFSKLKVINVPYKDRIESALKILDISLSETNRVKPKVTEYIQELQIERSDIAERIKTVHEVMGTLIEGSQEAIQLQELDIERAKVIGRISLYLDGIDWSSDVSGLISEIDGVDLQIKELEEHLDPEILKERLDAQLNLIGLDMTRWAKELKLEHSEHPIKIDINKLTVVAETPQGRIPLQKMGSGENWVGYHLITYLALAKWFIKQKRPVANFVFFDQPTQVYFPTDIAKTGGLNEIKIDEDRAAVRNMFEWLHKVVSEEFDDKFQLIVTDHADIEDSWFQEAIIDKKWRGDEALIPISWIKK